MTSSSTPALHRWLSDKSIGQRLNIQARASVILGAALIVTSVAGSFFSLSIMDKSQYAARGALSSALLEKDFASLERDVFQAALLRDEEAKAAMEGNARDLLASIASARTEAGQAHKASLDAIEADSNTYVQIVREVIAAGAVDRTGVSRIMEQGDKVDSAIEALREPMIAQTQELDRRQTMLAWIVMGITLLVVCVASLASFMLARRIRTSIGGELDTINGCITSISRNELDREIPYGDRQDELGALAQAAGRLRETSIAKRDADQGMRDMLHTMGNALRRLADGDLTTRLPQLSQGYEALRRDFNETMQRLHDVMLSVASAAASIGNGSHEISQASDDLARRTEQHAAELAQAAETINRIAANVRQAATGAGLADQRVNEAVGEASRSSQVVRKAVDAMANIERATEEIGKIISVIDGITFQTNLLALNAGVEAARAGEAGKGFAVVASEVRALAHRSSEAADEIKRLIESSTQEVTAGVALVGDAGQTLECIAAKVNEITGLVGQISRSAEEQSGQLAQTNAAMAGMDHVTQQNAAMVEESTAAARNLAHEAQRLTDLVSRFQLAGALKQAA